MRNFSALKAFLEKEVQPVANNADFDANILKRLFYKLAKTDILTFYAKKKHGGLEFELFEIVSTGELIASYSGALFVLQCQHQSAARYISYLADEYIAKNIIPQLRTGSKGIGLALSHLRNLEHPTLVGDKFDKGYFLSGKLKWISGFNIFDEIIAGFFFKEQELYCVLPFVNNEIDGRYIQFSKPLELATINSTNTVSATLHQWPIYEKDIIFNQKKGYLASTGKNGSVNVHPTIATLGITLALIRLLKSDSIKSKTDAVKLLNTLETKQNEYRELLIKACIEKSSIIEVRAKILNFATQTLKSVALMIGGRAVMLNNEIQRLHRELLQYTIWGTTPSLIQHILADSESSL